jgi:hypothetical protein
MCKSFIGIVLAISVIGSVATPVAARDQQCSQLEALAPKYAGVKLTPDQEVVKVKVMAWYNANCRGRQLAGVHNADAASQVR